MPTKTDDPRFTIPAGRRPEEYLDDAGLAEYYRRQLEATAADDPKRAELGITARRHARAAAATAEAVAEASALAEAELARSKK